ncbi:SWI/SNF-related matrix-associated actin-dependent regulator of chromatin subfamily A containing DEAD/H box 1 homolog [Xenia sp. Carnegie-2017]|uniref:SWI/SNF-related matrix-associated actin-dependent regulator of chromatin subfamily A containing DEAD/H box 1 homolog n=1 Tax=Xenia sp. Carnegie-2017 TaxID=2897299 RepID=UPI001F03647B|nr:SWI/SNF-related matrix-associated actin-dependent regulator of chromatin subfamily A containing DEAD/H box 1 homolog [Xenia sp. Carnegie-2017]
MAPFVLRRLKNDVLGNSLPPKHDHVIECELTPRQRTVYDNAYTELRKSLELGEAFSGSSGLGCLTELRKAANHSLLLRSHYNDEILHKMAVKYCKIFPTGSMSSRF